MDLRALWLSHTPNIDHIVGSVRDVLVIQQTQFDDNLKSLTDQERFSHRRDCWS